MGYDHDDANGINHGPIIMRVRIGLIMMVNVWIGSIMIEDETSYDGENTDRFDHYGNVVHGIDP